MAERASTVWQYRLLFVVLSAIVGFVHLLPINVGVELWPGPDVLLLIALSWTAMRPAYVPIVLVAAVSLLGDLLLMRPVGLWTALTVLGCEFLRSRRVLLRNAQFPMEWLLVASVVSAMTVVNALVLGVFGVPQPTVGLTVLRLVFTILCYPLVMILAGRAFGVAAPKERESLGQR